MIKRNYFLFTLTVIFLLVSGLLYLVHYLIFRDVTHIFIYMIGDLAFLPLEVLLVVVIIERILTRRETQARLEKLNMVVGAFFSEVGNHLLRNLIEYFDNKRDISSYLNVTAAWTKRDFQKAHDFAHNLPIDVNCHTLNFDQLKEFLSRKRGFLLTLLENPNLLEHD